MEIKRVFLLVLDSLGIGAQPDAAAYGDGRCNTLRTIGRKAGFYVPNLARLGLFNIDGVRCGPRAAQPTAAFARLRELSKGKDTTTGHWELAGLISEQPLPTYPEGFPPALIAEFERRTGRGVLCNRPYSGTEVIRDFGREQAETGKLIVYTSADSVFQIAAHEEHIGLEELYRCCEIARELLTGANGVGRVIARPYVGEWPDYTRTANRHDYSLTPPGPTVLTALREAGRDVIGVGKIRDIFAGAGISEHVASGDNEAGMDRVAELVGREFSGLCFVNLVDFDMEYGHRNDAAGYARALSRFDRRLGELLPQLGEADVLILTADHGCDPGAPGTDHTREYVPLLLWGAAIRPGTDLGTRGSFADLGATVLELLGLSVTVQGESFVAQIRAESPLSPISALDIGE